jgi:uncharacterized membrane protein YfcA
VFGLDAVGWAVVIAGALAGSVVGGVAGFGTGITLLPILTLLLGARTAIPVLTVTMTIGNLARVWWSRHDVHPRVVGAFLLGAVPATALGAILFAGMTRSEWLARGIGLFLLAALPTRRILEASGLVVRLKHFPLVGVAVGALSSIVVTTGPVATPFFLAHGLRRAAYIGTESVCTMAMHLTGGSMFFGTWIARRLLDRMSERVFLWIVEGLLVVMGLQLLLFPR